MRRRLVLFLSLCLMLLLSLQPVATAGVLLGSASPGGSPGTWYIGATPPNVDYTKPVLVFVHGKGGWSGSWWESTVYHGTNDMYAYAYNNGYRTAFVDLYPDKSMWMNGDLLNRQLDEITAYFGVSKVTLIAHSKGGVDANAASVHYGANPKISRVVTLGSPHWGTPVADMAYSTWTWWLAALLGERNDATYVMQTGYMSYFRSITDGRDPVPYYTLSGYKCGPVFTALWMGCAAISGEDDGLVPVWSARIPGGTHLKEGYWDHDEIRMGSRTWSYFAPVIRTASTGSSSVASVGARLAAASSQATDAGHGNGKPAAPGNLILRGGSTTEAPSATFPVESGVRSATFTFLASSPTFTATLVGPDGATQTVAADAKQISKEEIFAGAWVGSVTVKAPAAGQWQLETDAATETGYLMMAELDSDLKATLDVGQAVVAPGAKQTLKVGFAGKAPATSRAEAAVARAGEQVHGRPAFAANGVAQLAVPDGNAIHNVTVTITGMLDDGTPFERDVFTSFAAVAPGDRGTWK